MTVKEIICEAMRLVGRDDVADSLLIIGEHTVETTRLRDTFLIYYNSVIDELSRGYFPLSAKKDFTPSNGKINLYSFPERVVRIKKVLAGKNTVEWYIYADYLYVDAESVTVFYEYAPEPSGLYDDFSYPEYAVSERLVQYGIAAEYFLVCGCVEESRAWEQKYRDEIEALMARSTVKSHVPPRRWI